MYPPAPWTLKGQSLQSLHLLDIDRVRAFVPPELQILSLWPGKTVGGVYAALYSAGSTLLYSELIVVSALVYAQGKLGAWISHIYVDNPDSVAGGRTIWGLPKQLAQFDWSPNYSGVQIQQNATPLCTLTRQNPLPGLPLAFSAPVFSKVADQLVCFIGQAELKLHLAKLRVETPSASPLAALNLNQPLLSFSAQPLALVVYPPSPL